MNRVLYCFLLLSFWNICFGDNLKQITNKDGLSNSAILSICQDQNGYIWIGTCDGVNIYNGKAINDLRSSSIYDLNLPGNLIENIIDHEDIVWVNTNYSLSRIDKKTWEVISYPQFKDNIFLAVDTQGTLFTLTFDNKVRYFDNSSMLFREIDIQNLHYSRVVSFFISPDDILYVLTKDGTNSYHIKRSADNTSIELVALKDTMIPTSTLCMVDNINPNIVHYIDVNDHLFTLDLKTKERKFIYDLRLEVHNNGIISSIVCFDGEYYIGFKSKGLIKLQKSEKDTNFYSTPTPITTGVFTMMKDKYQDILWVCTDGAGLYILSKDTYTVNASTFKDLNIDASMPVRAIYQDKENSLWLGTKGDGIIKLVNFDGIKEERIEYYNDENSELLDDIVYSIEKSSKPIIWIGTEMGLNFYSEIDHKIHQINIPELKSEVKYIHDICEVNDSILWLATVGKGIIKLNLEWNKNLPRVTKVNQILAGDKPFYNFFFKIYHDTHNNLIWFGNRGFGAFYINYLENDLPHNLSFNDVSENQSINDIYAIEQDQKGNMWFGTTLGLVKRSPDGTQQLFNKNVGFPNDMIHAIVKDANENLWLGTNKGIIRFDIQLNSPYVYSSKNGLAVVEYSDGAGYINSKTNRMYLGGINGIATIDEMDFKYKYYKPSIRLEGLTIYGKNEHISNFTQREKNDKQMKLNLTYKQDVFSLDFIAVDFIDGNNLTYFYEIEGQNETWIDNGNSGLISFNKMQPGKYTLKVRYKNNSSGLDSDIYTLLITITPPWYFSTFAYVAYSLITLFVLGILIFVLYKRSNTRKEKAIQEIKIQHQKDSYNTKLSFFANIATEFIDPLTLIYAPCAQIIDAKTDIVTKQNASLIQKNATKINDLTQSLIEFAKYETEEIKPIVKSINIKDLIDKILALFETLAKNKDIKIKSNVDGNLNWYSDKNFLHTILVNLISQSIQLSNKKSSITVHTTIVDSKLLINIINSSIDFSEMEVNSNLLNTNLFKSENNKVSSTLLTEVGLALTEKLILLLEGTIDFDVVNEKQSSFTLIIPPLDESDEQEQEIENTLYTRKSLYETESEIRISESFYDASKNTITIMCDNKDTLWTLNEIFKDTYNIQSFDNGKDIQTKLSSSSSDILIVDLTIDVAELITLVKGIKNKDGISHIPIIVLSSRYSTSEQIEGVSAGVLMFMSKPFDVKHLKATIQTQMLGKDKLKKYLDSPLSAFVVNKGNMVHKETLAFEKKLKDIINNNIENSSLSVQFISDELNISSRQLYRKIKDFEIDSLAELIKEGRLNYARKLLINSKLTIDEVIYKSGFSNRATFFRAFNQKYNCTPKEYRDQNLQ